jgi:uncharacterized damage-inducible protein DinB
MNARLSAQFNTIEKSRKELFDDLKSYDDEIINQKPSPGTWSIAQVLEHLIIAEEGSLKYLQKKTQDTSKVPVAGFGSKWRFLLTNTVFVLNISFKAPAVVVPSDNFATIEQLDKKWTQVRTDTLQLLNRLPEADLKKEIWKHAIAGKMDAYQMVSFFNIHFNRHRKQVYRTLAENVL